jgi:hypothetical protein
VQFQTPGLFGFEQRITRYYRKNVFKAIIVCRNARLKKKEKKDPGRLTLNLRSAGEGALLTVG